MGDSISKMNEIKRRELQRFEEMKRKLLMYGDTPEEFRNKKKQKFRKRKLPFKK